MIDLHLHLLPGIDDGAPNVDVSIAMLERAQIFGFEMLVATPHLDGGLTPSYERAVQTGLEHVQAAARDFPVSIKLGFEIQLSPDLPARLNAGERSTLGGSNTVLVELPFAGWPLFTEQTLFDLQASGFVPLLAHPERYAAIQSEPERALDLAERGVLLQVTIGSLVGLFGKPAQRVAELLLRENATTVLASDAHSAGQRFMCVADGLARAEALVGQARLRQLVQDNPQALLENRRPPAPEAMVTSETADRAWRKALQRATGRRRL